MSDKEGRPIRAESDKREQIEKSEEKRSFRIFSQVIILIICLLVSFTVWLVVHYREDAKSDTVETGGEANVGYSDFCSVQ